MLAFFTTLALACTSSPPDDTGDGATGTTPVPLEATVQLLDAFNGAAVADAAVSSDAGTVSTGQDGVAEVAVQPDATFAVAVTADGYLEHRLEGHAATESFTYISFLASTALTDQVLGLLGLTRDESQGIVVVSLDTPDLAPAVGASADLDADYASAFVLAGAGVSEGTTVLSSGSSVVTFANVPVGSVNVAVTAPEGQACAVFPARTSADTQVEVQAGVATVVVYICE